MTLTLNFTDESQIDEIKAYMNELYDYIDLDKEHIPAVMEQFENTITIYMTERFFRYAYQFFMDKFLTELIGNRKDELEKLAKEFRQGAEEYLMSNVVL